MLVIDTSTERSLIALVDGPNVLNSRELPFGLQSSKHLLPALADLLTQSAIKVRQVPALVVGSGPGSYTGIRVGVAVAKMLSYATSSPLVGVSTLHGLIPDRDASFAALIDARIGGVYLITGVRRGLEVTYETAPTLCPHLTLSQALHGIEVIVTPNALPLRPYLQSGHTVLERAPCPLQMARLGRERLDRGLGSDQGQLEILYLRKTQAEIERQASLM